MGNIAIGSWWLRAGGEYCHREVVVSAKEKEKVEDGS